jgi:hypothetical protein
MLWFKSCAFGPAILQAKCVFLNKTRPNPHCLFSLSASMLSIHPEGIMDEQLGDCLAVEKEH